MSPIDRAIRFYRQSRPAGLLLVNDLRLKSIPERSRGMSIDQGFRELLEAAQSRL